MKRHPSPPMLRAYRIGVLQKRACEVAKAAGVCRETLLAMERGARMPQHRRIAAIASAYGMSVENLFCMIAQDRLERRPMKIVD